MPQKWNFGKEQPADLKERERWSEHVKRMRNKRLQNEILIWKPLEKRKKPGQNKIR